MAADLSDTVLLAHDYSTSLSGGGRPLDYAPRYLRTRNMGRWHRPRSGRHFGTHTAVSLWCGQSLFLDRAIGTGQPDDGVEVCGTCEGRALGVGVDPLPSGLPQLLFSPTACAPPRVCPGSRTAWAAGEETRLQGCRNRLYRCRVCGELVKGWASGGPYTTSWGLVRHTPGPGLVEPCPMHGWHQMGPYGEASARCRCQEEERCAS